MTQKRIECKSSRTAGMTCLSRAVSSLDHRDSHHSDDALAVRLLPRLLQLAVRSALLRRAYERFLAPAGIYEYVAARTKVIDEAFRRAIDERFDQIVLFGAGFDTRALRFERPRGTPRVFELDAPLTQTAKVQQYARRRLAVPAGLVFVPIDFARDPLAEKLAAAGVRKGARGLFILEGVLMYLDLESARATWRVIEDFAGPGSRAVFDYVDAAVLRGEDGPYGGRRLQRRVSAAGEPWTLGLEPDQVASFLAGFGFDARDHLSAEDLEARYFRDETGKLVGRVNGSHRIVIAERRYGLCTFSPSSQPCCAGSLPRTPYLDSDPAYGETQGDYALRQGL